jgi:hypothetical protein
MKRALLQLTNGCLPKDVTLESLGLTGMYARLAFKRAIETKIETLWFFAENCPQEEDYVLTEVIKLEEQL